MFRGIFLDNICFMFITFTCAIYGKIDTSKSSTDWFKSYENITATVHMPDNTHDQLHQMGNISFMSSYGHFLVFFNTESVVSIPYPDNLNSNRRNAQPAQLNATLVCKGIVVKPWKSEALVKIINNQLDVTILTTIETFVLEPLVRYFHISPDKRPDSQTYFNIFYKGSETRTNNLTFKFHDALQPVLSDNVRIERIKRRSKRAADKTQCTVYAVADHTYFKLTGHSDIPTTLAEMAYALGQVSLIFRKTDFDGDGESDHIGFLIAKTTILQTADASSLGNIKHSEDYLEEFSEYDHSDYCLATAFVTRDFEDGVVGVAWLASADNYALYGGICERPVWINFIRKSYNTNVISNTNHGVRFPSYLAALSVAHEYGHSFGSDHDPPECMPKGSQGHYLMYGYTSKGNKPNNNVFSPCSINQIYPVIKNKGYCLQKYVNSMCGNGIKEPGEECDCGPTKLCQVIDACCTPADVPADYPDKPCTLHRSNGSQCSPLNSPCCTQDCLITPSNKPTVCHTAELECVEKSVCEGTSAQCPALIHLNHTVCDQGRKTCLDGRCAVSICLSHGLEPCECMGEHSCHVCCSSKITECQPLRNNESLMIPRAAGEFCNGYEGRCTARAECNITIRNTFDVIITRVVDAHVTEWLSANWYYILLCVVVIMFITTVYIVIRETKGLSTASEYMRDNWSHLNQRSVALRSNLEGRSSSANTNQGAQQVDPHHVSPVVRVMTLFPTTKRSSIIHAVQTTRNEQACVQSLVSRGHEIRRFSHSPRHSTTCASDQTVSTHSIAPAHRQSSDHADRY